MLSTSHAASVLPTPGSTSRSAEIQRLIGRSLRAAVDRRLLGERTITVDCDVLQGDGGTRTASVTGGFIALALACRKLVEEGVLPRTPVKHFVAGISAGIIDDSAHAGSCRLSGRKRIK